MHLRKNACIHTTITIRNVPDETRNELAARAAHSGHSLQEYLRRELIAMAQRPDPGPAIDRIASRKRKTRATIDVEAILSLRDADRR